MLKMIEGVLMGNFKGMAKYEKSKIKKALINYTRALELSLVHITKLVKDAEEKFIPSKLQKLFKVKTLYQAYLKSDDSNYISYEWWLQRERYILPDSSKAPLKHTQANLRGDCKWRVEAWQLSQLIGGEEIYINPNQANFVNKFSVLNETEDT